MGFLFIWYWQITLTLVKIHNLKFSTYPPEGISMVAMYNKLDRVKLARTEQVEARENIHSSLPGSLHIFAFKSGGHYALVRPGTHRL